MKIIISSLLVSAVLIGGIVLLINRDVQGSAIASTAASNVTIVDGKQIVVIRAKGGYEPRQSFAKAGIPTILRFDTSTTFDCSSSVRIPSMNISKTLPQTGITDIDLGAAKAGTLQGACGMGMYKFSIDFRS